MNVSCSATQLFEAQLGRERTDSKSEEADECDGVGA